MKRHSRRLLLLAAASMLYVCNAAAQESCKLTATVAAVRDGRTLLLADGRELRLAGIEAGDDNGALQALTAGHPLRLDRLGLEQDRYGRLVGFAFVDDGQQSVQQTLPRVGDKACADALLHTEQAERTAKHGLGRSQFRPFVG